MSKKPVKLSAVFSEEPDQVELADGRIVNVRPIDGLGFDMYRDMEEDPAANGHLVWQIAARCLPSLKIEEVKAFTPQECMAVIVIAVGRVQLVQDLAEEMEGNVSAVTVAPRSEPLPSSIPPGSQ